MSWFWLLTFLFLSICVIADYVYKYKKAKLQAQAEGKLPRSLMDEAFHPSDGPGSEALAQRLEKIESRLANLETIVLDAEKVREFERQL